MTELPFIKMHGAGNDYVFIDGFETPLPHHPAELAPRISHRNFGVGSDGLVLLQPPRDDATDVDMRMWNADGSDGFRQNRPGWEMPIHELFVKHGVNIVFHGHDHLFVREELDGIIYQEFHFA